MFEPTGPEYPTQMARNIVHLDMLEHHQPAERQQPVRPAPALPAR